MATQQELEAGIAALGQKIGEIGDLLTDYAVDIKAAIDALNAQIASGSADLSPSIAALVALSDKVDAAGASIKALDVDAEAISGQPTPPPVA